MFSERCSNVEPDRQMVDKTKIGFPADGSGSSGNRLAMDRKGFVIIHSEGRCAINHRLKIEKNVFSVLVSLS